MRSEVTLADSDSDSDNFSVEFEVESIDSDDYNEDDASLSADDQVNTFPPKLPLKIQTVTSPCFNLGHVAVFHIDVNYSYVYNVVMSCQESACTWNIVYGWQCITALVTS